MFLDDVYVSYLTVLLTAIVYFILGIIWYSPFFFGHRALEIHHNDSIETKYPEQTSFLNWISAYVGEFILALIIAYVLALFIELSQAEEIAEGIAVSIWIWIGFIATTHFSSILWGRKSFKNFCIHAGFMLVGLILMASTIIYLES